MKMLWGWVVFKELQLGLHIMSIFVKQRVRNQVEMEIKLKKMIKEAVFLYIATG